MIPDKTRKEWGYLVTGKINVPIKNLALQMALARVSRLHSQNKMSMDDAITELHSLCTKYQSIIQPDINSIFANN